MSEIFPNSNFYVTGKPWTKTEPPKNVLAIRLQAFGDTFIAISYLQSLRNKLPKETQLDILVREEFKDIPLNLELFDNVYILKGGNRTRHQLLNLIPILFTIKLKKYDVVLDLQNNLISNITRKFIGPKSFVEFDRYSANHAGKRTLETINQAGIAAIQENYQYRFKHTNKAVEILEEKGWVRGQKLIALNPGGAHENRNWGIEKFIGIAKKLLVKYGNDLKFVIIGNYKITDKAKAIENELGEYVINLIEDTTQTEALGIIQLIDLMISEDGALLHMAYLSGKNTIGIIGPTRSDWMDPKFSHTYFFTSDDLECGNCMQATCKLPNTICMERVSVDMVFDEAVKFLNATVHA